MRLQSPNRFSHMEDWHTVEDTLPERGAHVWICLHESGRVEAAVYHGGNSWKSPDQTREYQNIISWIPRDEVAHPANPAP